MAGHPAYDGDVAHPLVSFPRPPPVVRLPPIPVLAPVGPPPKPLSFAAAVQKPVEPAENQITRRRDQSIYQDVRRQEPGGWQEKINSLVGRKPSPPKSQALAVDSASKHALELPNQQIGATVSLPLPDVEQSVVIEEAVESKPAAEECFEEQEMGSLPNVKVPNMAPPAAWQLSPMPKTVHKKFHISQVTSSESVAFGSSIHNNNLIISIKVPGQEEATTVSTPVRQGSNPRRGGASRGGVPRPSNYPGGGGRGGRDNSGPYPTPNSETTSTSPGPGRGRGRRGRDHSAFGSTWTRNSPTAVRT